MRIARLALLVVAAQPVSAQEATGTAGPPPTDPAVFQRLMATYGGTLDGAGTSSAWFRANPDNARADSPVGWLRVHRPGPGPGVGLANAFEVSRGGECSMIAHLVYQWSPADSVVRLWSFAPGGLVFTGLMEIRADATSVAVIEGILPSGDRIRVRDSTRFEGPDLAITASENWTGDTWDAGDTVRWQRDSDPGRCG